MRSVRDGRPSWRQTEADPNYPYQSKEGDRMTIGKHRLFMGLFLACLLVFPAAAYAESPMDAVKAGVEGVVAVAGDPSLTEETAKKEKLRQVISDFFDFTILSRLTLGKNWKKFKPDQQKEFVRLYQIILENVYMDRIMAYTDEKIVFTKEINHSEKKAEVQSKIQAKAGDIPINYRLVRRKNGWKVYDVVIEGISMVKNYRSQFGQILRKKSPEELLKSLQEKVDAA
jgi:phospholipid transport system substrate-binding protein